MVTQSPYSASVGPVLNPHYNIGSSLAQFGSNTVSSPGKFKCPGMPYNGNKGERQRIKETGNPEFGTVNNLFSYLTTHNTSVTKNLTTHNTSSVTKNAQVIIQIKPSTSVESLQQTMY